MRALLFICLLLQGAAYGQSYYLLTGTYTTTGSKGIYVYRFDDATGALQLASNTEPGMVVNPSYLTITDDGRYVYACTDTRSMQEGSISAFSFSNGMLTFINKQKSGGANPVYVALHNSGRWLVNGNYTGGSVSVFPVSGDGRLELAVQVIQHRGTGPIADRQEAAHVHAAIFAPQQDYVYVPDLGADKIMAYSFDAKAQQPLRDRAALTITTMPGSGPRHLAFSPGGQYAYCIEELDGTVAAYSYAGGRLQPMQRISAYRRRQREYNGADIHLSPDGRYLYATIRNRENSIAVFAVDTGTGMLTALAHTYTRGREPRNFIITPSGRHLLVANQVTGSIVVFSRDQKTGLLTYTGVSEYLPEPSCLQLTKVK